MRARAPAPCTATLRLLRSGAPRSYRFRLHPALALALAAALAACLASCLGRRAAALRQRVIGLPAAELERCLGAPSARDAREDRAVWLYEVMYRDPRERQSVEIAQGGGAPPRRLSTAQAPGALPPTQAAAAEAAAPDGDPRPRGSCVLVFELERGRVQSFRSAGRTPRGKNGAVQCARLASECAPEPPERAAGR